MPVLMFHSVTPSGVLAPHAWLERLSTPLATMEATFALWRKKGYRTLRLEELTRHLHRGVSIPRGALMMTLDDGYLDNWVALHPLLKEYGFHAVVFISTDYIDPRPFQRVQFRGTGRSTILEWKGYLSWPEMRAMQEDGTVDFQSHACTHTWYPVSPTIVDYYRPAIGLTRRDSLHRFLWLNRHPERKHLLLERMSDSSVPWGAPVYEFAPALVARKYEPDPDEEAALVHAVGSHGGARFFEREQWRAQLEAVVTDVRGERGPRGAWEPEEERTARVTAELVKSRQVLEAGLGKPVQCLSCPQGAMDDTVKRLAVEVGYKMWTASTARERKLNRPGVAAREIFRCGRGYEFLSANGSLRTQMLSHRLVLRRYAGAPWARLATTGIVALRRGLGSFRTSRGRK